ncbi:MAG: PKD domain-containing protein [Methanoregula sp.]|nr:PKD domain-containing protein [Methanoregula sp.]
MAFAKSSPPAGGTQVAAVPGDMTITVVGKKPDLVGEIINVPTFVIKDADHSLHLNATFGIHNTGDTNVTAPFMIQGKLFGGTATWSINDVIPVNGTMILKMHLNFIPGVTETSLLLVFSKGLNKTYEITTGGDIGVGAHEIGMGIDVNNNIDELNKTNNYVNASVYVLPFGSSGGGSNASIILPNTSVTQNLFTSIPIRVANMTRGTGLSFNITYDPEILRMNNVTLNQSFASAGSSLAVNSTAGLIRVALASTELITIGSPTTMFFLNVTGIGAQGSSTALNFQDAMWSNETFDIKQCNIVNGAVQISRSGGGEKQIRISSVSGVPLNSTGLVNVSIITPQSVNAFTMNFSYDPSVMNITHRLNDVPGWFLASGSAPGSYLISGFTVSSPLTTDTRLFDFQCEALRNDGKSTFINITITSIDENFVEMSNDYSTVNGTFTPAIIGAPVTNFRGTPTSGTAPLTVTFTDASANNPTGWNWNFGDGSTINATDQHPVHTYASAGIYNVSLNATNSGGSNMTTSTGYITVYASGPTLWNISMNVTSGTYNQNVIMGSAVSATRGYDVGLDIPVPPEPSGAKKIVHFSIEDAVFDHLSTDYKPPVNATNTVEFWTLYIKSNETVKVYWDARLAGNPNLTFLWNDGTTTVNMRTVTNATLPAGEYNVNLSVSTTARTDMSLKYGWNLVSVPFTSAQYVVPANAISTIYAYNPVTRGYEGPVQISSLEPGKAYWVAATRDCIINITGQPAQPIVKGLKTGWNLIGGTDSSVPFSSITIDPSGSWSLSFVYGYNVQTRMYDPVTSLQSGKGYWSAVNRDCTIIIP